jgi:hypothetical protein
MSKSYMRGAPAIWSHGCSDVYYLSRRGIPLISIQLCRVYHKSITPQISVKQRLSIAQCAPPWHPHLFQCPARFTGLQSHISHVNRSADLMRGSGADPALRIALFALFRTFRPRTFVSAPATTTPTTPKLQQAHSKLYLILSQTSAGCGLTTRMNVMVPALLPSRSGRVCIMIHRYIRPVACSGCALGDRRVKCAGHAITITHHHHRGVEDDAFATSPTSPFTIVHRKGD